MLASLEGGSRNRHLVRSNNHLLEKPVDRISNLSKMIGSASRAAMSAMRSSIRPSLAAAGRQRPTALMAPLAIRGYAEAVSDKLQLSLILPHQALYEGEVTQVNISATSGDMGILASHVPSIEQLAPGLLEVVESSGTKKWFGKCCK